MLTFILCSHMMCASGFSDWNHKTYNGTMIGDTGSQTDLYTNHTKTELYNLTKWYFYKNHIIGEYGKLTNGSYVSEYFILNELNGDIKTYKDINIFENILRTQGLVPIFWTRWYHDHYTIIQLICVIFIFAPSIATAVGIFIFLLIFASIVLKNKILKIIFIVTTLLLLLPTILLMINDYLTNSI